MSPSFLFFRKKQRGIANYGTTADSLGYKGRDGEAVVHGG